MGMGTCSPFIRTLQACAPAGQARPRRGPSRRLRLSSPPARGEGGGAMVEIVYYAAASLDGFIATSDGGIDWLPPIEAEGEDYGYRDFYASVDALLMGSATYEHILRHAAWPYAGKPCW